MIVLEIDVRKKKWGGVKLLGNLTPRQPAISKVDTFSLSLFGLKDRGAPNES